MTTAIPPRNLLKKNTPPSQEPSSLKRINMSLQKKVLKLENEKTELKQLVVALKSENLRLQKKIAKSDANDISTINRAKALQLVNDPHGDILEGNRVRSMTQEQLVSEAKDLSGRLDEPSK